VIVQEFESAVGAAKSEPKGVKVSLDLWRALKEADLIVMRDVAAWGVLDLGFQMPFYKNTILIYDPELEMHAESFQLPPSAT
jgi:hypothetical protein